MAKRKLTDAELAARDPRTVQETLARRARRARQKSAGAPVAPRPKLASVVQFPEQQQAPAIGKGLDQHGQAIFDGIQQQMLDASRWSEALAPLLTTYCAVSAAIAERGVENVSPGLLASQARVATILDLPTLPAVRRAAQAAEIRRFGLDRKW